MTSKQNTIQDADIAYIKKDISEIRKSIKTLNDHSIHMVKISTDVDWLKRFFWITITASIGGLITGIFNLLIK